MSDVRPFNARSLVLSVLLGLPRPHLGRSELMRLANIFGVAPGTARTALSRMAAAGDLAAAGGGYELRGRLLERKEAQDIGRHAPPADWDGSWWVVVVTAPRRNLADRREFRTAMANARMGELRPDAWLRPANTPEPHLAPGTVVVRGPLQQGDPADVVARLWDLPAIADRCRALAARLDAGLARLDANGAEALPDGMLLAAGVVRFLRDEPFLPPSLAPDGWPVDALRAQYRTFDRRFGEVLRTAITSPIVE